MIQTKCVNGHYFDFEITKCCPICGAESIESSVKIQRMYEHSNRNFVVTEQPQKLYDNSANISLNEDNIVEDSFRLNPKKLMYSQIRKSQFLFLGIGGFLSLGFSPMFVLWFGGNTSFEEILISLAMFTPVFIMFLYGLIICIKPELHWSVRTNPEIFDKLDKLSANLKYRNKLIYVADDILAPVKQLFYITETDKILWVYIIRKKENFQDAGSDLCICSMDHVCRIQLDGVTERETLQTVQIISILCPNVQIGYTEANRKRYNTICKEYKRRNKQLKNNGRR